MCNPDDSPDDSPTPTTAPPDAYTHYTTPFSRARAFFWEIVLFKRLIIGQRFE